MAQNSSGSEFRCVFSCVVFSAALLAAMPPPLRPSGSPRYFKPPQKVASLREEHHPYQGQPPPVAPPRITGYSGHRPKAWDSVGLNFNRVEYAPHRPGGRFVERGRTTMI